jgi:putative dimethyl sulfoxide reductase chaperone
MDTEYTASEEITLEEFARTNESRAKAYGLLSRLYAKEVDDELLEQLRKTAFPLHSGSEMTDAGNRLMATYLSNVWSGTLQELAVDYVHAFIGSGMDAFSAAYPYESVYTSSRRLMMQEARDEVLAIYRSQALDKAKTWKESEDHIAMECEFMAAMATRTAQACHAGDEDKVESLLRVQCNFLEDHLYAWTGMLTSDMRKFARTDFYKGLADYTDGFLESDVELLKDVLGIEDESGDEAGQAQA